MRAASSCSRNRSSPTRAASARSNGWALLVGLRATVRKSRTMPGGALGLAGMRSSFSSRSSPAAPDRPGFGIVELLAQALGRHADDGERLVDLVRHAGRHLAEVGEARGSNRRISACAALGVVDADQHDVAQAAVLVLHRIGGDAQTCGLPSRR